ncbi:MAG: GTPase Era [Bacteroidales bacterium]|nr:GTPase Era [Bacteroidales bacterium]
MAFKSGFVNIVGNPNVGKSTLMNILVGERLSIITAKSQTTRHRIMGVVTTDDYQIVYSDTPGVLKPVYKLQESMLNYSESALEDADVILYITDVLETKTKNKFFLEMVNRVKCPVIILVNKIDLASSQEKVVEIIGEWKTLVPKAEIYPVSALMKFNTENILDKIVSLLPENPPYFEKDRLTDKPERFFVSEIIREKVLENYDKEIPYSVEVEVETFKEEEEIIRIQSVINVIRESQKGIIIGKQGAALKKLGSMARKELETFFGKKIYLEIFVKVSKDWRDNKNRLRNFGYDVSGIQ